jgi:xanthine dehydrogenase YagS FAD-binding subunit
MNSFDFVSAADVTGAVRAGSAPHSRYVAGGTTLLDLMKLGVEQPTTVIDVTPLSRRDASLGRVTELAGGGLRLGALALMSDVAWDPRVRDRYPMLSQSLLLAASGQLRNMATMGGNILQRTRCPYFRDTATPCNKRDPGSGCGAIAGFNRTHAILGTSDKCIATHPSDLAVALVALDAVVQVQGATARTIPFADFHVVPGAHPEHENTLNSGELVTGIDVPALPFARHSTYLKVRDRASYAFALASAAVALDVQRGVIRDARVALGGVGTKPWRSHEAEAALEGKRAGNAAFVAAANAALAGARPHKDNRFKVELAKRTLVRALTEVSA